jgi:hypothetical protein
LLGEGVAIHCSGPRHTPKHTTVPTTSRFRRLLNDRCEGILQHFFSYLNRATDPAWQLASVRRDIKRLIR